MSKAKFDKLPREVQEKILFLLTVYRSVHVTFENKEYSVSPSFGVLATYPEDYKYIGKFSKAEEYWEAFKG